MIDDNMAEYIQLQRHILIGHEKRLREVNRIFDDELDKFDAACAARRISWDENPIAYIQARKDRIQLAYWDGKITWAQREVAARAALIMALDAADRMLDDWVARRRPA